MECKTKNRLKELCEQHELKRHHLAVELEVDPSTVYRWEQGEIPTQYIAPLTKRFGVTSDHLLGLDRIPASTSGGAV
ncbi:MAG TPA: helix-turn-helix transcriptional regulator [Solirubrobacterales bacterium]|nr:helix-turn-helix transcriptional regulator [Solirubrobacterales bacterium]